jgi:hypothetical protein
VLVACEFSAVVRDAFARRGHDAWSCDLLPTEGAPLWHMQRDVLDLIREPWDLIIAHPPCTYLTVAANGWHARRPEREQLRQEAVAFFMALYNAPSPRVAVENPVGVMSTLFRKPDQVIQPWMFGHRTRKAICLWLRGLPKLVPTKQVKPETVKGVSPKGKKYYSLNWLPASPDRWKIRSRFFKGIAEAMADQWGMALREPQAEEDHG